MTSVLTTLQMDLFVDANTASCLPPGVEVPSPQAVRASHEALRADRDRLDAALVKSSARVVELMSSLDACKKERDEAREEVRGRGMVQEDTDAWARGEIDKARSECDAAIARAKEAERMTDNSQAVRRWLVSNLSRRAKAHLIVGSAFGGPLTSCGLLLPHDASGESPGDTRCQLCARAAARKAKEAAR